MSSPDTMSKLTDEQIAACWPTAFALPSTQRKKLLAFARAIEAILSAAAEPAPEALSNDMLRYAMAAMGTGSPKEAERFRLFWRFAMEARSTASSEPTQAAPAPQLGTT